MKWNKIKWNDHWCFYQDAESLRLWQRRIPRDGIKSGDRVCEKHFREEEIIRSFEANLNDGTKFILPRVRCSLKSGAVPSIFPNCPKYLSNYSKQKRRSLPKRKINEAENKVKKQVISLLHLTRSNVYVSISEYIICLNFHPVFKNVCFEFQWTDWVWFRRYCDEC